VSAEDLFEKLSIKNKNLENFQMPRELILQEAEEEKKYEEDIDTMKKPCLIE
jgi:hypothetical protein